MIEFKKIEDRLPPVGTSLIVRTFNEVDCKNCVHYEVCGCALTSKTIYKCDYFADESKVIELPCKVGDTVYSNNPIFSKILPYFVENLNVSYFGNKDELLGYTFEANSTNEGELLDSIDFEPKDVGKTVFLTREEAEQALKERESK